MTGRMASKVTALATVVLDFGKIAKATVKRIRKAITMGKGDAFFLCRATK
ncbi:uncharacterized protein METZ01_LOCUS360448 [marine metagenome]|jgi:hypothetical protein|uniref:Uncharacterized protein n=1 Tax=marine metagenome TaxID=408172 RepID=A0A382SCG6_9ZZZZ